MTKTKTMTMTMTTLDLGQLATVTGGIHWGSIGNAVKRLIPPNGGTVPLGPFMPKPPVDPRVA